MEDELLATELKHIACEAGNSIQMTHVTVILYSQI
jgi:hypothetical protein